MNKYCSQCGTKQTAASAKFCAECGYNFAGTVKPTNNARQRDNSRVEQYEDDDDGLEIDYSKMKFAYKVDADNTTLKFGELAQQEKTGVTHSRGKQSKQEGWAKLKATQNSPVIDLGDDNE